MPTYISKGSPEGEEMSRGRTETTPGRSRVVLLALGLAATFMLLIGAPARSHPPSVTIDWGDPAYFGEGAATIVASEGDHLHFTIGAGGGDNHTVRIPDLEISSEKLDEGDSFETVPLMVPGTYTLYCQAHRASQGHETTLVVAAATTTTSSTSTTTTTTTPPGGTTTTTTSPPGGTTTTSTTPSSTTTSPGGVTTTGPPDVSTTLAGATPETTTSTVVSTGPEVPGAAGDGPEPGDQALGVTSPGIDDAGWLRPLWWTILGASIAGLVWVAIAWRRRPTEYD